MTVRVYRSSDASAPALTGTTAGPIIAILDACLVNGYGAKTAAGWTKPFTGTNLAAYKTGAGSNNMYLRVDDTATGAARAARVKGFEAMTAISTGTGQFPLEAQMAGGLYWPTVEASNATVGRKWIVVASEKFFYLYLEGNAGVADNNNRALYAFGDFTDYKTGGDAYATLIHGQMVPTLPTSQAYSFDINNTFSAAVAGLYVPRNYLGLGTSLNVGRHVDGVKNIGAQQFGGTAAGMQYPHPVDGGLYLSPVWAHENVGGVPVTRGEWPGLWNICHYAVINTDDEWDGTGALAGKRFLGIRNYFYNAAIEISDTWPS